MIVKTQEGLCFGPERVLFGKILEVGIGKSL
jgi:hypothetical protein